MPCPRHPCSARSLFNSCTPGRTPLSIAGTIQTGCNVFGLTSPVVREIEQSSADGAAIDAPRLLLSVSLSRARTFSCLYLFLTLPPLVPFLVPYQLGPQLLGDIASSPPAPPLHQGKHQDPSIVVPPHRLLRTHAPLLPCLVFCGASLRVLSTLGSEKVCDVYPFSFMG